MIEPPAPGAAESERDLVLIRMIPAAPAAVYRCWTEPDLLTRWFAPLPFTTPSAELDVRPGGASVVTMQDPQGNAFPNRGVYLEVVENARLVITDAYTTAWEPSGKPFMTLIVTFEAVAGGCRYTARARHWSVADREAHEAMGFHRGWGICADQLAALAITL